MMYFSISRMNTTPSISKILRQAYCSKWMKTLNKSLCRIIARYITPKLNQGFFFEKTEMSPQAPNMAIQRYIHLRAMNFPCVIAILYLKTGDKHLA